MACPLTPAWPVAWAASTQLWPDERWKVARRCGTKHMSKSKCTKHTMFGPLLEVEMSKKRAPQHISKSKCTKNSILGPLLEVEMLKKCTPLWRKAHFEVEMLKPPHVRTTFGRSNVASRGRRKGLRTLSKSSKTWGFCSSFKNDGRRGTFEEDLERCISRGRRSTRDTWVRCAKRSGRRFPERGGILEHAIVSFAKMILRDRCSTSYDLASLLPGRRNCYFFDVVKFENTLHYTKTTSTTTTATTTTLHYTTLRYTTRLALHHTALH